MTPLLSLLTGVSVCPVLAVRISVFGPDLAPRCVTPGKPYSLSECFSKQGCCEQTDHR